MKKFKFGLFGLAILLGGYLGSLIGVAVALCAFMTIDGLVEDLVEKRQQRYKNNLEKEDV